MGVWLGVAGGAILLLLVLYVVGLYNALVQVRANVEKAWANIDVVLKQRHDELPNLVEVCKGYMRHEAATLENVARLRGRYDAAPGIADRTQIENDLERLLMGLYVQAEAYPDLKANQNFLKLQERITGLENVIAARREFFNDSANLYNIRIQCFPERLFSGPLGFAKMEFLVTPAAQKEAVKVDFAPPAKKEV